MRLIDADTLKAAINRYADDAEAAAIIETGGSAMAWKYRQVLQSACALKLSLKIVDEMPTADAVEVVHCKDCHWNDRDGRCVNPKCGKAGMDVLYLITISAPTVSLAKRLRKTRNLTENGSCGSYKKPAPST